jgi:hypothetical protein
VSILFPTQYPIFRFSRRNDHRDRGATDIDHPVQIGLDLGAELLCRGLFNRPQVGISGIVHNHIDPTERFNTRCYGGLGGGLVSHVQWERQGMVPKCFDQVDQGAWIARGRDNSIAAFESNFGESASEAT